MVDFLLDELVHAKRLLFLPGQFVLLAVQQVGNVSKVVVALTDEIMSELAGLLTFFDLNFACILQSARLLKSLLNFGRFPVTLIVQRLRFEYGLLAAN